MKAIQDENKKLEIDVLNLQKKDTDDNAIILTQIQQLEDLSLNLAQAKAKIKSLSSNFNHSEKLCNQTIKIKLEYEEVISALFNDPITQSRT